MTNVNITPWPDLENEPMSAQRDQNELLSDENPSLYLWEEVNHNVLKTMLTLGRKNIDWLKGFHLAAIFDHDPMVARINF